uniref:Uncharacterized protein n=1 Tax=Nucleocytoviricota sp. TaxID=2809609 RepID=A0A9E8K1B0_9VIRU|nr:hypothetical protein [Nucleocytoviricota sp.]UZT29116.1 hypothetical protein [Nucleocytoviricota sp.]
MNEFIKSNIVLSSIVIFMFLFMIVIITKPSIIFNIDGTFRNFGIGYSKKTVTPIWLVTIILAIISYFAILFLLNRPKTLF